VLRRRLQVLADRDDVHPLGAQVAHGLDDLVVGLAHPDDHAGLRQERRARRPALGPQLLRACEQRQRPIVVALDAHLRLDPPARLDVVVEHVGRRLQHRRERLLLAAQEVGHEHLDVRLRHATAQRAHRRRPVSRAAVRQVVAVDARDDDVRQPHALGRRGDLAGLQRVERLAALAARDRAVAAGARARVAHDLERGRAAAPALADVRAAGLLAHGVQPVLAHDRRELAVARARGRRAHAHPLGALLRDGAPGHRQAPVISKRLPSGSANPV
jgi:hypothetical protein